MKRITHLFCVFDPDVVNALKEVGLWEKFTSFPPLYQRVRAYNVAFYKSRNPEGYEKALKRLVDNINNPDGSVGRLLTEDDVYNSVDSLLTDIDDLISKIKENPKKYLKISVF